MGIYFVLFEDLNGNEDMRISAKKNKIDVKDKYCKRYLRLFNVSKEWIDGKNGSMVEWIGGDRTL